MLSVRRSLFWEAAITNLLLTIGHSILLGNIRSGWGLWWVVSRCRGCGKGRISRRGCRPRIGGGALDRYLGLGRYCSMRGLCGTIWSRVDLWLLALYLWLCVVRRWNGLMGVTRSSRRWLSLPVVSSLLLRWLDLWGKLGR